MRTTIDDNKKALESSQELTSLLTYNKSISSGNTINTPYFDSKKFKEIRLNIHTDATINTTIEWSPDGSNNVTKADTLTTQPNGYDGHSYNNYSLYIRLVIENSSGATASDLLINLVGVK